eukprot:CAMPEP_0201870776 /NCGR_PEP_ID=MMETSP0902-20130614/3844_1 /ASSEMBLY_ACC=CAM_ASM_000551 /TAXON_ID=420261 /ORGANISM="Thalassiosira antarctica, Strain CCMP982" /LENGTH=114 /DNA_ID=CAMNT_0048396547 /DNA_START=35 /DNA_END=375 /DNA_ORIENTATION=+
MFGDSNQNGIHDKNELGSPNIVVALWCAQNGQPAVKVAADTTDSNGEYSFDDVQPGDCFTAVETPGYLYSPVVVPGGNQLGPNGRSPVVDVKYRVVIDFLNGGLYLPFEELCEG